MPLRVSRGRHGKTTSAGGDVRSTRSSGVANASGKKIENCLRIDFKLSQIEGLWIQLNAHPIGET